MRKCTFLSLVSLVFFVYVLIVYSFSFNCLHCFYTEWVWVLTFIITFIRFAVFCFVSSICVRSKLRTQPTRVAHRLWRVSRNEFDRKQKKNQQQTGNPSTMKIGNVCVRFLLVSCGFVYYNFCWLCLSRYPTLNLIYFIFLLLSIFAYTLQFLYDWFYLYHMISHGVRFESGPSFDSRLQKNNIYVYLIRWDSIEYNNITVHTKKHNLDTRI